MKHRHAYVLTLCVLILVVVAGGLHRAVRHKPGRDINGLNAQKIEECMSPDEVAATLGDRPGNYTTHAWKALPGRSATLEDTARSCEHDEVWLNDHFRVVVRFTP